MNSQTSSTPAQPAPVTLRRVTSLWAPLAASWLLMGVEMPLVATVVLRLDAGKTQMAALGSVVYPVSVLIEAPIIMLLAAATRLAVDTASWRTLGRFAHLAGFLLTLVHAALAFTPLFDTVICRLIDVPPEVVEPARTAMQIMLPWTWAIARRRYQQGALIRVEKSRLVSVGTAVRLTANAVTLFGGDALVRAGVVDLPGAAVGATAIAAGVLAELVVAEWGARRFVRPALARVEPGEPWSWRGFASFYLPLSLTPLISIALQPAGAAAMSRMPESKDSMAAWPVVYGLVFLFRALGLAFNEVVVSMAGRPGGLAALRTFALRLGLATSAGLSLIAIPPVGRLWFETISGMPPELAEFALAALVLALPFPFLSVAQNLFQGLLVHERRTRAVTEAVLVYAAIAAGLLAATTPWIELPGLQVAMVAFLIAAVGQVLWLGRAARWARAVDDRGRTNSQATGPLGE